MDLIYESYKEAVLAEAFKSKTLSNLFKKSSQVLAKTRKYNFDKQEYENNMSAELLKSLKDDVKAFFTQIDAANISEDDVLEVPVADVKKKINKKNWQAAIFTKKGLPTYFAKFFDDGTINYVSKITGAYTSGKNRSERHTLKDAVDYSDSAIVINDASKYFKIGEDKRKARFASQRDAAALQSDKEILDSNLSRYRTILAQRKAENPEVEKIQANMIKAFSDAMKAYSNFEMKPEDFKKYGDNKILKFLTSFEKEIANLVDAINDAKTKKSIAGSFYSDYGRKLAGELYDAKQWLARANKFIRTGEL